MGNVPSTPDTIPTITTTTPTTTPSPTPIYRRTNTAPSALPFRIRPKSTASAPDRNNHFDPFSYSPADEYALPSRSIPSSPLCDSEAAEFLLVNAMPDAAGLDSKSAAILKSVAKKSSMSTIRSLIKDPCSASHDTSDIDINAAVAILKELKKKASPEDLIALHKALLPSKSDNEEAAGVPVNPSSQEPDTSPLIRRSSLMPPGVATRTKTPSKVMVLAGKVSREHLKNRRPLSDQFFGRSSAEKNALKNAGIKVDSSLARSYTPADLDITHIGTYRPGTLHITNGAVSPEPSLVSNNDQNESIAPTADDYFSAEEGNQRSDSLTNSSQDGLSIRERILQSAAQRRSTEMGSPVVASPAKAKMNSPIPGLESYQDSSDDDAEPQWSQKTPRSARRSSSSAIADDYATECQLSSGPFKHQHNGSNGSYVSRLSTVVDQDESSAVGERVEDSDDALRRLTGSTTPKAYRLSAGSQPSFTGPRHPNQTLQVRHRPSMAQSDSGYGSELAPHEREAALVQYSDDDEPHEPALPNPALHPQLPTTTMRTSSRPETLVSLDRMFGSSFTVEKCLSSPSQESLPAQTMMQRSDRHMSMPIMNERPPPSSSGSSRTVNSASTMSVESTPTNKSAKPRTRLHKPPPQSPSQRSRGIEVPPTPANAPVETVPTVSDETSINFSRRIAKTPGMAHLDNTYDTTAQTSPKTPQTPQLNNSAERGRKDQIPKQTPGSQPSSAEPGSAQKKRSLFRLRGRSRSKSLVQPEVDSPRLPREDQLPTVADTVPQYSELSPSEITAAVLHDSPVRPRKAHARYYSQDNSYTPIPSALRVGMDERTASELARRKSKDVALAKLEAERSRSRPRAKTSSESVGKEEEPSRSRPQAQSRAESSTRDRSRSRPHIADLQRSSSRRSASAHAGRVARRVDSGDIQVLEKSEQKPRQRSKSVTPAPRVGDKMVVEIFHDDSPPVPRLPSELMLPAVHSPTQEASHPGWPGWERQQSLWRERRKTLTEGLPRTQSGNIQTVTPSRDSVPGSPAIVVSRYVTPSGAEHAVRSNTYDETMSTSRGTEPIYRAYNSNSSPIDNPTENRPAKSDVPRTDSAVSAISTSTYRTANSTPSRTSTPLTSVSGNSSITSRRDTLMNNDSYRAYRSTNAQTMNKLTTPTKSDKPALEVSTHHQLMGREATPSPESLYDRFSGGLDYGWERGVGFNGSAGTRPGEGNMKAKRKSAALSESFGVDLSDIPVFLTRAN